MPYFTSSDGLRLYYELKGSGEKTVVLVNGILMNTASWKLQAEFLISKGFRVLLHDLRGQGASDKPRTGYTIDRHVLDLKELLDFLGIRNASLIGISYGGKIVLAFAKRFNELVDRLIALNTSHTVDRALIARIDRWILASRFKSGRFLWQVMVPDIFSDRFLNENFAFVSSLAPSFEQIDFVAFEEMAKAFIRLDMKGTLHDLDVPTLIVAGTEDKFFPPRYSKMIVQELPRGKYVEIDSGHVSIWEKSREVNEIIYKFLRGEE